MTPAVPILLLCASIVPVALLFLWLYYRDRLREPAGVVLLTLLLGVLIAAPAIALEIGMMKLGVALGLTRHSGTETLLHAGFNAFAVAALVEEALKFGVLWFYAARRDAFDEPMDGIVYGAAASLGFAGIENVLYVMGNWMGDGGSVGNSLTVASMRAFTAVPMHAAFGVVMGACIGVARFTPRRRHLWIALGLAGAIGLHGFYNFTLMSMNAMNAQDSGVGVGLSFLGTAAALAASTMVAVLALARLRRDQEVAMAGGSLPPVRAPRLPMATCILAAVTAATAVIAVSAGLAAARGSQQDIPMGQSLSNALQLLMAGMLAFGAATSLATVLVGAVSLVRQRRWRVAAAVAVLVGGGVGVAYAGIGLAALSGAAGGQAEIAGD